jgi:hypothetical protein
MGKLKKAPIYLNAEYAGSNWSPSWNLKLTLHELEALLDVLENSCQFTGYASVHTKIFNLLATLEELGWR